MNQKPNTANHDQVHKQLHLKMNKTHEKIKSQNSSFICKIGFASCKNLTCVFQLFNHDRLQENSQWPSPIA